MYRTAQKYCKQTPPIVAKVLTRSLEELVLIYLEAELFLNIISDSEQTLCFLRHGLILLTLDCFDCFLLLLLFS